VLQGAVDEILQALEVGARQVIYFAQDKQFLRAVLASLLGADNHELNSKNVHIIDSSVPGWRRKQLVSPRIRDTARVFLMTSSGARGVSFPLTDWILASVPRFNVEAALMEIAQLIYRGRGQYLDSHGVKRSGDNVPRHLVMLVDEYVVGEHVPDKRQWLRHSIDLMTLLVMLRATIYTRITGDAGLRQKLALVPVGAVGMDELISLMSQYVVDFMREANLYKMHGDNEELRALVGRAHGYAHAIFSRTKLQGVAKRGSDGRTMVKRSSANELTTLVTTGISPLLVASEARSFPDYVSFSGPVIVENWSDFDKQEVFAFEAHEEEVSRGTRALLAHLRDIEETKDFPSALRNPAANLRRLLQRDQLDGANAFRTLKALKSPNTWVALPAGYYQFMYPDHRAEGEEFLLEEQGAWRKALATSLNASSAVMPPLPRYESFPWAASVGQASPLRLDLVFDDRYFMASNELNLLNTLLLASAASEKPDES
jgi:hypothetical protein